jgi:4-alpha-glucanotransferase
MNLSPEKKIAGVLVPLFAVRGENDLGIGDLGGLREFIDWVAGIGFKLIQLLPINETGADNSPYNAISAMAIEPTTLHVAPNSPPDLTREDFEASLADIDLPSLRRGRVKYGQVKVLKQRILEKAFAKFSAQAKNENRNFKDSAKKNPRGCASTRFSVFSSRKMVVALHGTAGRLRIGRWKRWPPGCAISRRRNRQP